MSSVPAGRFRPSREGMAGMLNMAGVQGACLDMAGRVAATAAGYGYPVTTDVRPGEFRCHARASIAPAEAEGSMGREYYRKLHTGETAVLALQAGALASGGDVSGVQADLTLSRRRGSYAQDRKAGHIKEKRKRKRRKK